MRSFAVGLPLLVLSVGALAYAFGGSGGSGSDPIDPPPPPATTEFAGVLLRVGLGAEALAAAGLTSEQTAGVVAAVEQEHNPATLASRDAAFIAAKQTHDRLRRLVTSGKGTQEDVASLRTAETTLATATSNRDGYLDGLRAAGLATVSSEAAAIVNRVRVNTSWHFPTQYLVKDRTEADWVALRDALAAKRISEQDPEEDFPQSAQTHLSAVDAEAEIATAKVNLDSNIASIQTAWNVAASE
jgi:hypothetical protein